MTDTEEHQRRSSTGVSLITAVPPNVGEKDVVSNPEESSLVKSSNTISNLEGRENDSSKVDTANDSASVSLCEQITSRWIAATDYVRETICRGVLITSKFAALNPITCVVVIVFVSFSLVGIGFATNFNMNVNARQMLTPFGSLTREQNYWIEEVVGFPTMPHSVRIMIHNQGENVVTREGLFKTFEIAQTVLDTPGYNEFCQQSEETNTAGHGGLCHIRGVPLFWNLSLAIAEDRVHWDSDVKLAVSQPKLPDNSTVDPREFMGHIKYFADSLLDTIESAESFLMELRLPAHGENSWQMAQKLLNILLDVKSTWSEEEGATYRLEVYLTDFSLESESLRAVFQDIPLIAAVFVVMSLFTCLVFSFSHKPEGSENYRQRLLLGFGAVLTILLSMSTAYGIMFIIGMLVGGVMHTNVFW
jgi:Patched family